MQRDDEEKPGFTLISVVFLFLILASNILVALARTILYSHNKKSYFLILQHCIIFFQIFESLYIKKLQHKRKENEPVCRRSVGRRRRRRLI
jgi:hypothetical protein